MSKIRIALMMALFLMGCRKAPTVECGSLILKMGNATVPVGLYDSSGNKLPAGKYRLCVAGDAPTHDIHCYTVEASR